VFQHVLRVPEFRRWYGVQLLAGSPGKQSSSRLYLCWQYDARCLLHLSLKRTCQRQLLWYFYCARLS
jgi:hypothetical protein